MMPYQRWMVMILLLNAFYSCRHAENETRDRGDREATAIDIVSQHRLKNERGLEVRIINHGATITNILFPDRRGDIDDIVLGFDAVDDYLSTSNPFMGCIVGRYANRIAKARFVLEGDTVQLTAKNIHSVHGGIEGFDKKTWEVQSCSDSTLVLYYLSVDGEEGFPGNLRTWVTYTLTSSNELQIDYLAMTDKPTPVNLTNHTYFNLSGRAESTILNHQLFINADYFTEVGETLIPTGSIGNVEGGALDFTVSKEIGRDIFALENGYDHNWVLNKTGGRLSLAAIAYDPSSGRGVEVRTTQPGLQFYTGNYLSDSLVGKQNVPFRKHAGFCLETQHYPDSPNHSSFPSTILYPGDVYYETTVYTFFTK